jgi:Xaa-Pro dipeptidase
MSARVQRLIEEMRGSSVDCVALVHGPNLAYLTGLQGHLSERPTIAFFPADGQPALLVPNFEAVKAEHLPQPIDWQFFSYTDEEGPDGACARACDFLGLAGKRLGVEQLTMRVLELEMLRRDAPGVETVPAEPMLAALRMLKDADELAHMRQAATIAEKALSRTLGELTTGMTERQIAAALKINLLQGGSEGLPFEPLVQTGPNSASPHAGPSSRELQNDELLLIDFGAVAGGYASDITRTFATGKLEPELVEVYRTVQEANGTGRAAAGPGVSCQEVDRAARRVIEEAGYGEFFIHRTGHGLGLEGHEPPYLVEGNALSLEIGMTFTIEPGIYLPGRGGVRIEDNVVVTEHGSQSLTTFERGLKLLHLG